MKNSKSVIFKFINEQLFRKATGSGLIYTMLVTGITGGIAAYMLQRSELGMTRTSSQVRDTLVKVIAQRASALGSFVVTNSLVMCKEDPWYFLQQSESSSGKKGQCLWTTSIPESAKISARDIIEAEEQADQNLEIPGVLQSFSGARPRLQLTPTNDESPEPHQFGLSEVEPEGWEDYLTYKLEVGSQWDEEMRKRLELPRIESDVLIGFKLIDWEKKTDADGNEILDADKIKLVGGIPNLNALADDDTKIVLVRIEIKYRKQRAGQTVSNGQEAGEPGEDGEPGEPEDISFEDERVVQIMTGIRRPLGVAEIVVSPTVCSGSCIAEVSADPSPSCVGEVGSAVELSQGAIRGYIVNRGPGPIYKLAYHRQFKFNRDFFSVGDFPDPEPGVRNFINSGGTFTPEELQAQPELTADVIEPGGIILFDDVVDCPNVRVTRQVEGYAAAIVEQHGITAGYLEYRLQVSRFNPKHPGLPQPASGDGVLDYLGVSEIDGEFVRTGVGSFDFTDPTTYEAYAYVEANVESTFLDAKNLSIVEPKKLSGTYSDKEVVVPGIRKVITIFIPPH